jgi:cytochrome c oxidase cbb3-type subunit III
VSARVLSLPWRCVAALVLLGTPLIGGAEEAAQTIPDWIKVPAYPVKATDPAAVERGRNLFMGNGCSFCHGQDARGGNGGPSLLRSQRVLHDKNGEMLLDPITKGVANTAMVAFPLKAADVADIAAFLHSFPASGYDKARILPKQFVTGDARAGKKYFDRTCASCHSPDRDLKGLATRYPEPRALQQHWLMPHGATPVTAVLTAANGDRTEGALLHIDEFLVTLRLADGTQRSFERDGAMPKVEVHDPRAPHQNLLPLYADRDIHNLTAYLVTLK